jgi:riboflavin kinase/FMN adenylyltransferase
MRIYQGHAWIPTPLRSPAVTVGNFDGVHLGHQALLREARECARRWGGDSVVFTFRPHPVKLLAPDLAPPLISPYEVKLDLIARCGIDVVIEEPFTRELAEMPPREFAERILVRAIGARVVIVGHDFTFGRGRSGNVETLAALGWELGFEVRPIPAVTAGDLIASSTKVREFILEGRVRGAAIILGREFSLTGTVVRGVERGRTLGIPTANLRTDHELLPKPGVYACQAFVRGGRHPAVVNIGYAPTFEGKELTIEAHLLDFSADIYGEEMTLQFRKRLRDERTFPSAEALKQQIARDIEEARSLL